MNRRPRKQRGYIMLFVLLLVLVLTILSARLLSGSFYDQYAMMGVRMQMQALMNSQAGVQDGLARVRTGQVSLIGLPYCASADPPCAPVQFVDPSNRYVVSVFQRGRAGTIVRQADGTTQSHDFTQNPTAALIVVSATGNAFAGAASSGTANTNFSTVLEAEAQIPTMGSGLGSGAGGMNEVAGGG